MNERTEVGRVALPKPLKIDALSVGQEFFPGRYYKTSTMADGSVYIARTRTDHSVGQTVVLFSEPSPQGFGSVYSPLQSAELLRCIEIAFANAPGNFLARRRAQSMKKQILNAIGLR